MNPLRKTPFYITKSFRTRGTGFLRCSHSCAKKKDEGGNIKDKLIHPITCDPVESSDKITVIGAGFVGMACVISILAKQISSEVVLLDQNQKKVVAEVEDLQHGCLYLNDAKVKAANDYCCTSNSRVCVITCGAGQIAGQSRLELVKVNTDIMKKVVPKIVEASPDTIIVMASNPVDILSYVALKVSGLPPNRCFGTGCILDSSRFRHFVSKRLQIAPASCHAMILGEHGDSSVPIWSLVNVAGTRLAELNPCIGVDKDPLNFQDVHQEVVKAAAKVQSGKGYTNWGIGLGITAIVEAILKNRGVVIPASIYAKGFYGIKKDVCLSLPCIINADGATAIVKQKLSKTEKKALHRSADILHKNGAGIKF